MVTYQVIEGTVDNCCSLRVCGSDRLIHQPYSGQDHLGDGKDCGSPLQGWLRSMGAVFDLNRSAGPATEYLYNEDLLKKKHEDDIRLTLNSSSSSI